MIGSQRHIIEKQRLFQDAVERLRAVKERVGYFSEADSLWLSAEEEQMLTDARTEKSLAYNELVEALG